LLLFGVIIHYNNLRFTEWHRAGPYSHVISYFCFFYITVTIVSHFNVSLDVYFGGILLGTFRFMLVGFPSVKHNKIITLFFLVTSYCPNKVFKTTLVLYYHFKIMIVCNLL
jgi:hypothetical protein